MLFVLAKRSSGDPAGEHALKEEKDQKIQVEINSPVYIYIFPSGTSGSFDFSTILTQTLQKMMERQKEAMERQKEDLRNEKANRKKTENALLDSLNKIEQVFFFVFHTF